MSEMGMSKRDSPQVLIIPTMPALVFVLALVLTSTLLSLVLSLVTSFRLGDMMARPNPFNNYEVIWPGHRLEDVAEYVRRTPKDHITCYSNAPVVSAYPELPLLVSNTEMYDGTPQPITCMGGFEREIFRSINILIKNDQIQELNLFSDTLQQDVLSLYWGVPDSITKGRNGESLYLHWDRDTYAATAMLTRPYLMVSLVTIKLNA